MTDISQDTLYEVLTNVARKRDWLSYLDLSEAYHERTREWHEPHGSWDDPLGELNRTLHRLNYPPLSAVVVLRNDVDSREPGGRFWGSCPGIPDRPRDDTERILVYSRILGTVHACTWPDGMPTVRRT